MSKSAWQGADDFKSQIFPKAQRSSVGRDNEVELHGPKTEMPSFVQTMFSHRSADSATSGRWRNHEAGISDVRSKPRLVGFKNVATNYPEIG